MSSHYHHTTNASSWKRDAVLDKSRTSFTFLQRNAECTGSDCKVSKNSSSNVTVAVAVAVPVGAIIILLSVVLVLVYRRSKKETLMQDLDPNFEGDLYYLPKMDSSINSANSEGNSTERRYIYGSYDDYLQPSTDKALSFKDYVKRIHDRAPSAYNIASLASRNISKASVVSKQTGLPGRVSLRSIKNLEATANVPSLGPNDEKKNSGQKCDNTSSSSFEKNLKTSNDSRLELGQASGGDPEPQLLKDDGESIDRIRSIYNIYFERSSSSIRTSVASSLRRGSIVITTTEQNPDKNFQNDTTLADQGPLEATDAKETDSGSTCNDDYEDVTDYLQAPASQKITHIPSSVYSEMPFKDKNIAEPFLSTKFSPPNATSTRIASSIYSELPAKGQLYSAKLPVRVPPLEVLAHPPPNYSQQYRQYRPKGHDQEKNNYYYSHSPSSLEHPQNFENIGELPTPTRLAYSTSSHSLTSFKGSLTPSHALKHVTTARLNGTALNPMDHPEMFYNTPTEASSAASLSKQSCIPLPYQLRQSVVMTNPSDLSIKTRYKPAGSLGHLIRAQQLPSSPSTITTPMSLSQQRSTVPTLINVRVSGLLDDSDVLQPPNGDGILPFTASVEDLRKQLGTPHKYEMTS
ncbi:Tos2p [Saccharomyces eubayanus]|uniref:Tos2p n=1 Tax=Saccharomyces eubayanus TaxID=1080349 RepID=UPI0006BF39CE|nr:TOS2-like protein [Saccharomyces eubayanus]KOG99706.1 TOS2-like protein [Saccharomyces eubayanus]